MSMPHSLIIDDQAANVKVLGKLLEQQGVTYTGVTTTIGVDETIESLERVDVVFVDLELPGEAGYRDIFQMLRDNPRLSETPIIAYTVHVSEIDTTRQVGFDGFIAKPLKSAEFPRLLERILNHEPVWVY